MAKPLLEALSLRGLVVSDKQLTKEEAFSHGSTQGQLTAAQYFFPTMIVILDELLTKWEEMGYTFGTLNDS